MLKMASAKLETYSMLLPQMEQLSLSTLSSQFSSSEPQLDLLECMLSCCGPSLHCLHKTDDVSSLCATCKMV